MNVSRYKGGPDWGYTGRNGWHEYTPEAALVKSSYDKEPLAHPSSGTESACAENVYMEDDTRLTGCPRDKLPADFFLIFACGPARYMRP